MSVHYTYVYPKKKVRTNKYIPSVSGGMIGMGSGLTLVGIGTLGLIRLLKYAYNSTAPFFLVLVVALVCVGVFSEYWIRDRISNYIWQKEFLTKNADLNLDLIAIKRTISWLNIFTEYKGFIFRDVATYIAHWVRYRQGSSFFDVTGNEAIFDEQEVAEKYTYFSEHKGSLTIELRPTSSRYPIKILRRS